MQAPAPVTEYISPALAVSQSLVSVVEYFSPAPTVFQSPAPLVEYFSPAPAVLDSAQRCFREHSIMFVLVSPTGQVSTAFGGAEQQDHQVLRPERSSAAVCGTEQHDHKIFFRNTAQQLVVEVLLPRLLVMVCKGVPEDRVLQRFAVLILLAVLKAFSRDRVQRHFAKLTPTIKLWMRKNGADQAVQAFQYTPLRSLFRQHCSHVGLKASHVRFICGELLSPDETPAQAGLEDDHILDVVVSRGRRRG